MTVNIPYPYEDGMAERWITGQYEGIALGQSITFAITLKPDHGLIGAVGLSIHQSHHWGELGYWIGKPFWSVFPREATQRRNARQLGVGRRIGFFE